MKAFVAAITIGLLGVVSVALAEEDRIERAVREARELQAQQNQNTSAEAWLQSIEGQRWLKTFQSTPQESMHVAGAVGSGEQTSTSDCVARVKRFTDSVSSHSIMRFDKRDLGNAVGEQCANWFWDHTPWNDDQRINESERKGRYRFSSGE